MGGVSFNVFHFALCFLCAQSIGFCFSFSFSILFLYLLAAVRKRGQQRHRRSPTYIKCAHKPRQIDYIGMICMFFRWSFISPTAQIQLPSTLYIGRIVEAIPCHITYGHGRTSHTIVLGHLSHRPNRVYFPTLSPCALAHSLCLSIAFLSLITSALSKIRFSISVARPNIPLWNCDKLVRNVINTFARCPKCVIGIALRLRAVCGYTTSMNLERLLMWERRIIK